MAEENIKFIETQKIDLTDVELTGRILTVLGVIFWRKTHK